MRDYVIGTLPSFTNHVCILANEKHPGIGKGCNERLADVAVVVALLSLIPAVFQAGSAGAAIFLLLMHIAAAGSIVWALTLRQSLQLGV